MEMPLEIGLVGFTSERDKSMTSGRSIEDSSCSKLVTGHDARLQPSFRNNNTKVERCDP